MKRYILVILLLLLLVIPISTRALSSDYVDKVSSITNTNSDSDKISIYLFHGDGCPHCKEEIEWLKVIEKKYKDKIVIYKYEVWNSDTNQELLDKVKKEFGDTRNGVPYTVIGDNTFVGFSDTISLRIEDTIKDYLYNYNNTSSIDKPVDIDIPLIGNTNVKDTSILLVGIILGLIDGFNPCAMWILLLLINMCITVNDKKKMWILGFTFILTGGLVYFLSMLGIGFILDIATVMYIRDIIALVAVILGIYNLYVYIKTRKETGCHVVKGDKRKKIITKIKCILNEKSLFIMLFGIITLAISVNLIELTCSLGFPTIYLEILSVNNVSFIYKILYLIIYILFYIIDDLIVLILSLKAFSAKGISTKYNKYVNLIGGIIMIIMGILLLFKPEWVMFNF